MSSIPFVFLKSTPQPLRRTLSFLEVKALPTQSRARRAGLKEGIILRRVIPYPWAARTSAPGQRRRLPPR